MAEQSSLFPEGLARSQLDLLAELAAEGAGLEPDELRSRSQQHVVRTRAEYQRNRLVNVRLAENYWRDEDTLFDMDEVT